MKVIALRDYTDKHISLYEGEIRNVEDVLANWLIQKGICGIDFPDDIVITTSSTSHTSETEIADIKINGKSNKLYAPSGSTGGAELEKITWSELKAKRDNSQLTPGGQYRITDYVCTTTQEESRAVSHPFDIIVIADDESTLNENARACLHEGDTYYSAEDSSAILEAWELKYCIDNDNNRFGWADTTNGKGVIYWMRDNHGNECPYDFKQIQFKRYEIIECTVSSLVGKYISIASDTPSITRIDESPVWMYTFSEYDPEIGITSIKDATITTNNITKGSFVFSNIFKPAFSQDIPQTIILNNNVFIVYLHYFTGSNTFGNNCLFNTFGNNYLFNTFGNKCNSNIAGDNCIFNKFGDYCNSNTFGDNCRSNTFGSYCSSNSFGNYCSSNTFRGYYNSNTFGDDCMFNTFGDNCSSNTFGNYCCNTFGDNCRSNTFGNYCSSNTFGSYCSFNTFGNNCKSNTFGSDCSFIDFFVGASSTNNRYYNILSGISGQTNSRLSITGTGNNNYTTYVGKNSSGVLKTWVPADLVDASTP